MLKLILLIIFGYFLASIPFGYLISKMKGVEIKKVGSGNIGATNISRALGKKWAIIVAILDIAKAIIPIYLATIFLSSDWQIVLVAVATILGHNFPVWLRFSGGKGISATAAAFFVILGWKAGVILVIIWLLMLKQTRTMSFVNLILLFFLPFVFWLLTYSFPYFILGVMMFFLGLWTHRENVSRLYKKEELKL